MAADLQETVGKAEAIIAECQTKIEALENQIKSLALPREEINAYYAQLPEIKKGIEATQTSFNTALNNINDALAVSNKVKEQIDGVFASTNQVLTNSNTTKGQIDGVLASSNEVLANANKAKEQIDGVLASSNDALSNSNKAKEQIDAVLVSSNQALANSNTTKGQIDGVLIAANEVLANSNKTKEQIDAVLVNTNDVLTNANKTKDQIDGVLVSTNEVLNNANKAKEQIDGVLSGATQNVEKLGQFYNDIFNDEKGLDGKISKPSLKSTIDFSQSKLDKLIDQATKQLYSLTDSSLHNTFAVRAAGYTTEFKSLEKLTFLLTLGVVLDIIIFGIIEMIVLLVNGSFNYHILIYQFSIAGALVFAIWMFNRNQKIAKKLAESYHHKAALAEAMTGYRKLYDLEHDSKEYMELFNALKEQLNTNPANAIDGLLNLKSPQEELVGAVKDIVNPENIRSMVKEATSLNGKG